MYGRVRASSLRFNSKLGRLGCHKGLGFRALGFRALGFRGLGFRVGGVRFRVQGLIKAFWSTSC